MIRIAPDKNYVPAEPEFPVPEEEITEEAPMPDATVMGGGPDIEAAIMLLTAALQALTGGAPEEAAVEEEVQEEVPVEEPSEEPAEVV